MIIANMSRRSFLGAMGATGLLLVVGCGPKTPATAAAPKYGADSMPNGWVTTRSSSSTSRPMAP